MSDWVPAFPLSALPIGGALVFKHGQARVAVFRLDEETVHAVDNACPHEGYALAQGGVSGGVLTCAWHNYKFDLRDGRCLMGEEHVRSWPVRVVAGEVRIDVTPPDPAELRRAAYASLEVGLREHRIGQVARDLARLLEAGVPAQDLALFAAMHDARFGQYGTTHGFALAVDSLRWMDRYEGLRAVLPLVQAYDMVGDATVRRSARPRPEPIDPGTDRDAAEARLEALVEEEVAGEAEALLRGMLDVAWPIDRLERVFLRLCAAHFLSFGHRLIYTVKAFDLLRLVGDEAAGTILPALLHGIVTGTREDTLPRWAPLRKRLEALEGEATLIYRHCTEDPVTLDPAWRGRIESALMEGPEDRALQLVEHAVRAGVPLSELVDALSRAAAARMLRFDLAHDRNPDVQDDWLTVTHVQTTVHALRAAVERLKEPAILRLFFLVGRFIQRAAVLDLPAESRWAPPEEVEPGPASAAIAAVVAGDVDGALAATHRALQAPDQALELRNATYDLAIGDAAVRPIVVAHVMKNVVAAWDERAATGDDAHVLGLVRFLASSPRERRVRQRALEAIRLVGEGKIPRTLAL